MEEFGWLGRKGGVYTQGSQSRGGRNPPLNLGVRSAEIYRA